MTLRHRMPVIFAAHGAPILLDDEEWMGPLMGGAFTKRSVQFD